MEYFEETFKGAVRISDVKNSFDNIVDRINNLIDSYNKSSYIQDIDYSVGAKTLAPAGYTLSIGGLKQILKSYDGCVIGAKPFRTTSGKVVMTDGILITESGTYRLPCSEINVGSNRTIYFNTSTKQYVTNKVANCIRVCDVNMKSDSIYCKDLKGVLVEDFKGNYSITTESKTFGDVARDGNHEYPDTSKGPKFVAAIDSQMNQYEVPATTTLFGTEVAYNWQERSDGRRDRVLNYWTNINFLFLPKGVNNPYHVTSRDNTHTFDAIIEKKVE